MPTTMGAPMGTTLDEGPRRRMRETVLVVVGCQVMVKGLQAGTICSYGCQLPNVAFPAACMRHTSFNGRVMGLPEGSPTGACCAAATLARRVTMEALVNMLDWFVWWY